MSTINTTSNLTKMILVALALTVGGTSMALADGGKRGERAAERFEQIDADGNGAVTLAEFSAPMLERFNEADADSNGQVNAEEVAAVLDGRRAERMAERMIDRFDIDGNDQISVGELENRQAKMFALLDFDDSGSITAEEMQNRIAMRGGFRGGDRDRN